MEDISDNQSPQSAQGNSDFVSRAYSYLEGQLDSQGVELLQNELRASDENRQVMVQLCLTRAGLVEKLRNRAELATNESPHNSANVAGRIGPDAKPSRFSSILFSRGWMIAASVLLVCSISFIAWTKTRPNPTLVSMMVEAKWDGADARLTAGSVLPPGVHNVSSGIVQITLSGGAVLAIEGPAQFNVIAPNRVSLASGRITASVPHSTAGLSIQSPDLVAVDLGTKFGIEVIPDVQTRLDVFEGSVRADLPNQPNSPTLSKIVTANHAVIVTANSTTIQSVPTAPAMFVRPEELPDRARLLATQQYNRWRSYSERLRRDPGLILYYAFDNQSFPSVLTNLAASTSGKFDGKLEQHSPNWDRGRWDQKGGLRFDSDSSITIPEPTGLITDKAITVACWVQRSDSHQPMQLLHMAVNQATQFGIIISGTDGSTTSPLKPNSIYFTHTNTVRGQANLGTDNAWHLITITTGPARKARFYVDGKLMATSSYTMKPIFGSGDLTIGNHAPDYAAPQAGPFRGKVDELAIFNRALSSAEIAKMFDAGRCD